MDKRIRNKKKMSVLSLLLFSFGLWLINPPGFSEEISNTPPVNIDIPIISCPLLSTPPAIDGKLDDPAWETAQVIPRFPEDPLMSEEASKTKVYLGYDGSGLYLGYRCEEKNMAGLVAKITENGGPMWTDDSVEVMLDGRATGAGAFHLLFNANGVFFGQTWEKGGWKNEFTGKLHLKATKGVDYWSVEVKLPFESLGGRAPKAGETWRANFTRMRVAGNVHHIGAWYPTRNFIVLGKAGYLCFTDGAVVSVDIPHGKVLNFGKNEIAGKLRTTGPRDVYVRVQVWGEKGEVKEFLSEKISCKGAGEQPAPVPVDIASRGKMNLGIEILDASTREVLYRLARGYVEIPQRLVLDGLLPCYYSDEDAATVHVRLNLTAEERAEIAGHRIEKERPNYLLHLMLREIALAPGAEGDRLPAEWGVRQKYRAESRWISHFPEAAGMFGEMAYSGVFRVRNLPEGKYGLKVKLLYTSTFKAAGWEQGGHKEELNVIEELPEEVFYVIPPPSLKREPIKEVTIGAQGEILVNGKVFFPLGLYWAVPEGFGLYARQGFNLADAPARGSVEGYRAMLARAQKEGIYVNINLLENFGYDKDDTFVPHALDMVRGIKGDPAILVYNQPDEVLGWTGENPVMDKCLRLYEGIRGIDPTRLIFADTTAGPYYSAQCETVLGRYARFADVIVPDVFSIGSAPIAQYYDFARRASEFARSQGKTSMYIPQAFTEKGASYDRWPGFAELRAQAYLVIMGGVKGISWYKARGYGDEVGLQDNPKAWAYMKKLNAELTALTEVLGAAGAPEGLRITPSDGVKTWHRALGKKHFVFVANVDETRKELAMTWSPLPEGAPLDVHGEYRQVLSGRDQWGDAFGPLEVHVYIFEEKK